MIHCWTFSFTVLYLQQGDAGVKASHAAQGLMMMVLLVLAAGCLLPVCHLSLHC
jgi:hypothetical protein